MIIIAFFRWLISLFQHSQKSWRSRLLLRINCQAHLHQHRHHGSAVLGHWGEEDHHEADRRGRKAVTLRETGAAVGGLKENQTISQTSWKEIQLFLGWMQQIVWNMFSNRPALLFAALLKWKAQKYHCLLYQIYLDWLQTYSLYLIIRHVLSVLVSNWYN